MSFEWNLREVLSSLRFIYHSLFRRCRTIPGHITPIRVLSVAYNHLCILSERAANTTCCYTLTTRLRNSFSPLLDLLTFRPLYCSNSISDSQSILLILPPRGIIKAANFNERQQIIMQDLSTYHSKNSLSGCSLSP